MVRKFQFQICLFFLISIFILPNHCFTLSLKYLKEILRSLKNEAEVNGDILKLDNVDFKHLREIIQYYPVELNTKNDSFKSHHLTIEFDPLKLDTTNLEDFTIRKNGLVILLEDDYVNKR